MWVAVTATGEFVASNTSLDILTVEVEKRSIKDPAYHFIPDFKYYYAP